MKPKSFGFVLATAGWLLLAGCVQGTVHERNASFSCYSDNRLGLESTKDFLTSRTALLFGGVRLTITPSTTNSHMFNFQAASSSIVIGCAAAVDRRGYFLTVAHALGKEPPWLVFGPSGHMQAQRARVVWRGGRSSGEPDLALLWVPSTLQQVFEWAPDFRPGDRVLAAGVDYNSLPGPNLVCLAGTLKGSEAAHSSARRGWASALSATSSGPGAGTCAVFHTVPLHKGDSGGPLVDLQGRLIGINVRGGKEFSFLHPLGQRLSGSERPELLWLRQLIEGDAGPGGESR